MRCQTFHSNDPPIPTRYIREKLGVIPTENSVEFNEKNLFLNPWCRDGDKDSSVFCKYIHAGDQSKFNSAKLYQAKRRETLDFDDVFSPWDCKRNELDCFIE